MPIRKIIGDRVHLCSVRAVSEYVVRCIDKVRADMYSLPGQCDRFLYEAWLLYVLALRMCYGRLPGSPFDIAVERSGELIEAIRSTIERELSNRKEIPGELRSRLFSRLAETEISAKQLTIEGCRTTLRDPDYEFPKIRGVVYILRNTRPHILMRRAIMAQLLHDRPKAKQVEICKRLDFHHCPIPAEWEQDGTNRSDCWQAAYKSAQLKNRVKKLISDEIDELRKWGGP
jgi:hypothetical protein